MQETSPARRAGLADVLMVLLCAITSFWLLASPLVPYVFDNSASGLAQFLIANLVLTVVLASCDSGPRKPPALHQYTLSYAFTIQPDQAPPHAQDDVHYSVQIFDRKTRQQIEGGDGHGIHRRVHAEEPQRTADSAPVEVAPRPRSRQSPDHDLESER